MLNESKIFPNQSLADWEKLVEKELKGKPLDSLVKSIEEGITLHPFYTSGKSAQVTTFRATPHWSICQSFKSTDAKFWNQLALESLQGGSNALVLPATFQGNDLAIALTDIQIGFIEWELDTEAYAVQFPELLRLHQAQNNDSVLPLIHKYHVSANTLFSKHATPSEQLAYAALKGIEIIEASSEQIDEIAAEILYSFTIGRHLYTEIAKLRAFRALWHFCMENTSLKFECSNHVFVKAETDQFFQATKDTDNNLIRSCMQALSAILGGANRVEVHPMEATASTDHPDQLRWARNMQHLLWEESHLNDYKDVAKGSFALEQLTEDLASKAYTLMNELGSSEAIMNHVESQFASRKEEFEKRVVVGQNKYVRA